MKKFLTLILLFGFSYLSAQDITSYPYQTSFEGFSGNLVATFPAGWTSEDLNTITLGNQGWQIIKNSTSSINAHTDSTAVHMFSHFSEDNNDWLYTPSAAMEVGTTYKLIFWYKSRQLGATTEKLKVHIGTVNNATHMLSSNPLWDNSNVTITAYTKVEVFFTPSSSDNYYFAFHYYSDAFSSIIMVDDLSIDISPVSFEENLTKDNFSAYYTPSNQKINFQLNQFYQRNLEVNLWSIDGKLINTSQLTTNETHQNISAANLPKGVYLLELNAKEGNVQLRKKILVY